MGTIVYTFPEKQILGEIADKRMRRRDVAQSYSLILRDQRDQVDWAKINHAILERWSPHALNWIKEQAWTGKCWAEVKAK